MSLKDNTVAQCCLEMHLKSWVVNGHALGQAYSSRIFLLFPLDDDED